MSDDILVRTENLTKRYPMGGGVLVALDHVTLQFRAGEFAGLVGPSGSGKTTLLNIMGSLDVPSEGSAVVLGERIETLSHDRAAELRNRHIGFIFQTFNLLPVYTVFENVEFPLLLLGLPPARRRTLVMQALDRVHLADRARSRPAELSGGESQRVAISRAIVKEPKKSSSPTSPRPISTPPTRTASSRAMERLNHDLGTTFIFSTHDDKVIRYLRRRISLVDGRVAADEMMTPAGAGGGT